MRNKNISFEEEMYRKSHLPDIICGIITLIYSFFILKLSIRAHFLIVVGVFSVILFAQFVLSKMTNHLIMHKVSASIEQWKANGLTKEERTDLFLKLHKMPEKKQREAFAYFMVCSVLLALSYKFILNMNPYINAVSLLACLLGAFLASQLALSYSRRICTRYACELVEDGIDEKILKDRQYFGISYNKAFVLYCIIPVIWGIILAVVLFYVYYFNNVPAEAGFLPAPSAEEAGITGIQLSRLGVVLAINVAIGLISGYSFLNSILISSDRLQSSMEHILKNDVFTVRLEPTDFETEFSFNMYLVNQVILLFRSILDDMRLIGQTMIVPIRELTVISESTASTALEQSTGVKEILATMEDTDRQARNIVEKIADVTDVAEDTEKNVNVGFETLQTNLDKMTEITEANVSTISGIRELGEKIGSIWEIVKIINDIADQTRIIAFNAELEASSAGESGKNFHIVANEVRRLAAGITNSVDQIKEKITEIQHSSDNLIITSESGTEKIREGMELSEKLKEKFSDIQSSSEITVESANQIKDIISQQSASFDQIVATVRQISSGIENFSASTDTVNNMAQKLKDAAKLLENLQTSIISAGI